MCAESHKFNDIIDFIHPNQQEIASDVALHTTFVPAEKHVRFVLGRNRLLELQQPQHFMQCGKFRRVVPVPLKVFPELRRGPKRFHSSSLRISLNISSMSV